MLRSHRESGRRCSVSTQTKHTEGEWIVVREARQAVRVRTKYRLFSGAVRGVEICRLADVVGKNGNANLIAEAGTVAHETGLSPRQLAEQRQQWRAIETAPKDGTDILVDAPDMVCGCTIVHWKRPGWRLTFDGQLFHKGATQPTLWMPLPAIARAQGGAV